MNGMDEQRNKQFLQNDDAIAWGLSAVFIMIFLGGSYYLFNLPILNSLVGALNNYIGFGMVSQATADTLYFGRNVIVVLPLIMLLGFFAWLVVRSHERRDQF